MTGNILKSDHIISDEVKKLGLTAQINRNLTKDEPCLFEIQPKERVRHRSAEFIETNNIKAVPNLTKSLDLKRWNYGHTSGLSSIDTQSDLSSVEETDATVNLDLQNMSSSIGRTSLDVYSTHNNNKRKYHLEFRSFERTGRGLKRFSDLSEKRAISDSSTRRSMDDLVRQFPGISFHQENEVIKRASSAECLRKLQDRLLLNKDIESIVSDEEILHMSDSEEDERIKRCDSRESKAINSCDSSKINNRFLNNNQGLVEKHSDSEVSTCINGKKTGAQKHISIPSQQGQHIHNKYNDLDGHEHEKSIREQLNYKGKESIHWLKSSKVNQTKRENNWISPVSF